MRVLCLGVLLLVAGFGSEAAAEKVKTNQTTKLHVRPGEMSKTILTVKAGKSMTVLGKDGRWLKVRVNGRTGYVPRSKIDRSDDDDRITRNTRRRSFVDGRGTKRGFTGVEGPSDRVGADAIGEGGGGGDDDDDGDDEPKKPRRKPGGEKGGEKGGDDDDGDDDGDGDGDDGDDGDDDGDDGGGGDGEADRLTARVRAKTDVYSEADTDSDVQWVAKPDMLLFPTGNTKGKFTEVENDEGDLGYVLTEKIEVGGGGKGGRQIDVRARIGFLLLTQGMRTTTADKGVPNNYNLQSSAARIALGGTYLRPWKPRLVIGGEVAYDLARTVPGIDVGMGQTTDVTLHDFHLRGVIGYDLQKASGAMVFGRLGLRYESYQVADVEDLALNIAKLPSEITIAPMLGVAFAMPRLTDKIGVRATLDAMLIGASMKQTRRLEDGADPSVRGALVGLTATYAWKRGIDLMASYDLVYQSIAFGSQVTDSMRQHAPGEVSRTDIFHAITFGVAKGF